LFFGRPFGDNHRQKPWKAPLPRHLNMSVRQLVPLSRLDPRLELLRNARLQRYFSVGIPVGCEGMATASSTGSRRDTPADTTSVEIGKHVNGTLTLFSRRS
jgi:hypothetical protein